MSYILSFFPFFFFLSELMNSNDLKFNTGTLTVAYFQLPLLLNILIIRNENDWAWHGQLPQRWWEYRPPWGWLQLWPPVSPRWRRATGGSWTKAPPRYPAWRPEQWWRWGHWAGEKRRISTAPSRNPWLFFGDLTCVTCWASQMFSSAASGRSVRCAEEWSSCVWPAQRWRDEFTSCRTLLGPSDVQFRFSPAESSSSSVLMARSAPPGPGCSPGCWDPPSPQWTVPPPAALAKHCRQNLWDSSLQDDGR